MHRVRGWGRIGGGRAAVAGRRGLVASSAAPGPHLSALRKDGLDHAIGGGEVEGRAARRLQEVPVKVWSEDGGCWSVRGGGWLACDSGLNAAALGFPMLPALAFLFCCLQLGDAGL